MPRNRPTFLYAKPWQHPQHREVITFTIIAFIIITKVIIAEALGQSDKSVTNKPNFQRPGASCLANPFSHANRADTSPYEPENARYDCVQAGEPARV